MAGGNKIVEIIGELIGNLLAYGMMILGWIIMAGIAFWVIKFLIGLFCTKTK